MSLSRKEINQLGTITGIKYAALSLMAGALAARLWMPLLWVGIGTAVFFLIGALLWINYDPDKPLP